MSQIQILRKYILNECEEHGTASLVDIMARFDFHQHSIPTLNEMRQAIKGIESINISRKENEIFVNIQSNSSPVTTNEITKEDMQATYNSYINVLKQ